jgi:hypothetical protein
MKTIFEHLKPLAEAEDKTEKEFLRLVQTRFKEAEAIIGVVATTPQVCQWVYRAKAGVGRAVALSSSSGDWARERGRRVVNLNQVQTCSFRLDTYFIL